MLRKLPGDRLSSSQLVGISSCIALQPEVFRVLARLPQLHPCRSGAAAGSPSLSVRETASTARLHGGTIHSTTTRIAL